MKNYIKYFLISVIAWFVMDFLTTSAIASPSLYYKNIFALLLFYIGYPLIFTLFIYKFKFNKVLTFIAMLFGIFIVEILLSSNKLLLTFPTLFIAIPLALAYYGLITFIPLWIVEDKIEKNIKYIIPMVIVSVIGIIINIVTQFKI